MSKSEDDKLQQHRVALQAANEKNLQLSGLIVKMAEQLKEESRLSMEEEANEIAYTTDFEPAAVKEMSSSDACESEAGHSDM